MATANARVQFVYVTGNSLPATPDGNTVYFVAGAKELYVGSTLIASHSDLSSYALESDIPSISVSGTGDVVTGAAWDSSTKSLTITKGTIPDATTSASGLMSSTDKSKLDGVETGAEANELNFSKVVAGGTDVVPANTADTLTLSAGSNVSISASGKTITIAATDTTYSAATTTDAGLMSAADKTKLDGVATGAEVNVQADWSESDSTSDAFILNKPTNVSAFNNDAGYLTSATLTVPEYSVTKTTGGSGDNYSARYTLTKDGTAVSGAATIDIPKDMVVESGVVRAATAQDVTDAAAQGITIAQGDTIIVLTLANATSDKIIIPANDLVDVYTAGTGIDITNHVVSVDTDVIATKTYAESQALVWDVVS